MKIRLIQISLVITISISVFLFPAYLRFANLAETNLFSTDLSLENADQQEQFDHGKHESNSYLFSVFLIKFVPGVHGFDPFCHLFSLPHPLDQKAFILRC